MSGTLDYPVALPAGDRERAAPRWLMAVLLTLAAVAVGYAIHLRDGEYTWPGMFLLGAIHWVGLAILLTFAAVVRAPGLRNPSRGETVALAVLAGAVALQFVHLFISPPGGWYPWSDDLKDKTPHNLHLYRAGLAVAAVLAAGLVFNLRAVRAVCVPLLLLVHLGLGVWMVRSSPQPEIDVFVFQQEGPAALLRGENPYAVTFEDIYQKRKDKGDRKVYGQGMAEAGRTNFGFPYPPVSLFMVLPAYALAGDHRYAQAVAMTLAGAFLAYARPGQFAALAAVLLLFTPRAFFVLGRAWSEPLVVCLLAATVFCACRDYRGWLLPLALGLFLASKQYLLFAVPAAFLLLPRPLESRSSAGLILKTMAAGAIVTLPLALWDFGAFFHSLVTVQKEAPFRDDALSYLVWIKQNFRRQLGVGPAFAAATVALVLCLWRAPRTPAGFAGSLALIYLTFIALNKQAFANYYYFTIGCLCCAVGAIAQRDGTAANGPDRPLGDAT